MSAIVRCYLLSRLIGGMLLLGGAFCLRVLFHATGAGGVGSALLAVGGFLGTSFGAGLLILGQHIHDRVPVARRWGQPSSLDW